MSSRHLPRSVYVRRRLLLLAAAFLVAWIVVQLWPKESDHRPTPTSTATVTALPSASPSATPKPTTPVPTKPAEGSTTKVALAKASKACASGQIAMLPSVQSPQHARRPVFVDVAITTSAKKPCVFTPKGVDPLAVISHDGDTVWDSSVCEKAVVSRPVELVPGWATTVRVPWVPRKSGGSCKADEDWVKPGTYTLRVGTLGGEPGRADFKLVPPPPPPATPTPTPSTAPTPPPTPTPTAAQPKPSPSAPITSPKPAR